jgi:hypothetical protein
MAGLVSLACFAPWYWHVERTFEGGYATVTANHWRYVGSLADWPFRAERLWLSLTAFRHVGWAVTVLLGGAALVWQVRRYAVVQQASAAIVATKAAVGFALLVATFVLGCDAVVAVVAVGAVLPALIWGRWPEVLFAVWTGTFLIMTPFYHPYTRLLLPAWPAVIALAVWMFAATEHSPPTTDHLPLKLMTRALLAAAGAMVFLAALVWHPFGWIPSRGAWSRWSSRQSYRALGDAVSQSGLPEDAVVLCQGPPAMTLYLARQWAPLELVPFQLWLPRIEPARECYLAVDSWGLYAENHQGALASFRQRLECLEPVASVSNDLNLVTLLDYLPAAEVARHISDAWPAKQITDVGGRAVIVPAALGEPNAEVIVLYRIDRNCTDLLDRTHGGALQ